MKKLFNPFLLFALLFISASFSQVQAQEAQSSSFDYMDIFELQMVGNPEISPDGNIIIYERHQFDVMTDRRFTNLWSISFSGENHQPLTSGKSNYGNVSWSPSGDRLLYTSSSEGSNQIFIRWMNTGETASITNLTKSPGSVQWSPDGKMILFTQQIEAPKPKIGNFPGPPAGAKWEESAKVINHVTYKRDGGGFVDLSHSHIYVMSADGGAARQVTSGDFNHSSPTWAPDSKSILFTSDRTGNEDLDPNNAQIYEINLETGELTQRTNKRGPHGSPKISPDGKLIAYTGYEDKFLGYQLTQLYVMNRDGSNLRMISDKVKTDMGSINWAKNSQSIFFSYDENGDSKVGNIRLNGDFTTIATGLGSPSIGRPYGGGSYSVADNGRFAFSQVTTERPTELFVGHFPTRMANRQLTNLNAEFFKSTKVGKTEEFWVESSVDDFKTQGWIITPPDFDSNKKYPMILEIHGGPHTNYGSRFTPELQVMASKGYVVVYTNPRGSTSYGEEFAAYINHNYPSEDHNDLMDAVDYVVEQGYVDSNNLFITGGSGGGVLTAWAIGKTDRFKAAVVAKPVINWYSFVLTADAYPFFSKYWFTEKPWDDPEQFLERSPLSLVGNVKTPTMLLTGEQDYRTPMSESEQYYQALKLQGVDAAMVRIQGSGHGLVSKPSNFIRKVGYIVGWFDMYKD